MAQAQALCCPACPRQAVSITHSLTPSLPVRVCASQRRTRSLTHSARGSACSAALLLCCSALVSGRGPGLRGGLASGEVRWAGSAAVCSGAACGSHPTPPSGLPLVGSHVAGGPCLPRRVLWIPPSHGNGTARGVAWCGVARTSVDLAAKWSAASYVGRTGGLPGGGWAALPSLTCAAFLSLFLSFSLSLSPRVTW